MAIRASEFDDRAPAPPYGPARGTLQALHLLRRTTPLKIDSDFLRLNKIAPGNEYKVVGALKFLGLIDDDGRPTSKSRLLKTKGNTYTSALQEIVRTAYAGVLRGLRSKELTRDEVYNYFVTEGGLGAEMAAKATRFFIRLCRLAEIELAPDSARLPFASKREARGRLQVYRRQQVPPEPENLQTRNHQPMTPSHFPVVLALTPETASMNVEQLTELFRKVRIALDQSAIEQN